MVEPAFIVVSGLPGTGKSHFCITLAKRLPFVILESDALRKSLFPSPNYSPQESSRLFRACHLLIERFLKKGIPLILDATNLSERFRERLYNIADRLNVKLILVRVEAPTKVVHERLEARQKAANPANKSDADWEVRPVLIKRGVSIGAGAVILPGVTVGEFAMVGAGSVVACNIPAYGLVYGNPACLHGYACRCGHPLTKLKSDQWKCEVCGERYTF